VIRRSLTPSIESPEPGAPGLPLTRRAGGARRNVSYRVAFFRGELELPGWALNLSRGGLRAVVEDRMVLGEELEVRIDEISIQRRGRVVWTQDEPDGTIVGFSFFERIEVPPAGIELDSSLEIAPSDLARQLGMTEAELRAALDDTEPGRSDGGRSDGGAGGVGGGSGGAAPGA
jgi:PilZ domain